MSMIFIHLDCVPPTTTAQQKGERIIVGKNGKPFIAHYEKKKVKEARALFCGLLKPFVPAEPLKGPIACECQWVFPWRKSERKAVIREFTAIPKTTEPDVDNSNKLLIDCLTQMKIINNDAIIYDLHPTKWWGDRPGIYLQLTHGDSLPAWPRRKAML